MKLARRQNKNPVKAGFVPLFLLLLFLTSEFSAAGENANVQYLWNFQTGAQFYNEGSWNEAAAHFRRSQETAVTADEWAQALYWVIMTELALSDYGSALRDMDELQKYVPNSSFNRDMSYHRARVYFNLGYFEDALLLFKRYNDSVSDGEETAHRRAAAFFWMGECLFTMGQFNEAEKFYTWVITRYPGSPKNEISGYRIDLIKQKKIEAELLALLRWSHEESLRTSEVYQRRIRTYEYTLNAYQRRIAELTHGSDAQILSEIQEGASQISTEPDVSADQDMPHQHIPQADAYHNGHDEGPLPADNAGSGGTGGSYSSGYGNGGAQNNEMMERAVQLESDISRILNEIERNAGGHR